MLAGGKQFPLYCTGKGAMLMRRYMLGRRLTYTRTHTHTHRNMQFYWISFGWACVCVLWIVADAVARMCLMSTVWRWHFRPFHFWIVENRLSTQVRACDLGKFSPTKRADALQRDSEQHKSMGSELEPERIVSYNHIDCTTADCSVLTVIWFDIFEQENIRRWRLFLSVHRFLHNYAELLMCG